MRFYTTHNYSAGKVIIVFTSTPQYYLYECGDYGTNFPSNLPSEVDKIWRITLNKTAGIRLMIHCNGVEVVNILMSDSTCGYRRWRKYWSRDVEYIEFYPSWDTASDYLYRAVQTGICKQHIFYLRHSVMIITELYRQVFVNNIYFISDTASDYYRAVQTGICKQHIFYLRHSVMIITELYRQVFVNNIYFI